MAEEASKGKKELISKANSTVVAATAISAFVVVFSLFASKALWSQRGYQSKVIAKKETALKQLDSNKQAVDQLRISYASFNGAPDNVLGGNPSGTGNKDGENATIVLDALPSKYDFPAFVTSLNKLLSTKNYVAKSIGGTDDELAQTTSTSSQPVDIPFQFTTEVGNFAQLKDVLTTTELSIRPLKIKKLGVTGGDGTKLQVNIDAVTSYQGAKGLTITKEVVK